MPAPPTPPLLPLTLARNGVGEGARGSGVWKPELPPGGVLFPT